MKYLFDYSFRVVENILVHLRHMEHAIDSGRSEALIESVCKLQDLIPHLKNIQEPTYSAKQTEDAGELAALVEKFILLPEDMEISAKEIALRCGLFLQSLNPFIIQDREPKGLRRTLILAILVDIQDHLEDLIETFQIQNRSVVLPMTHIEHGIEDLQTIDIQDFSSDEIHLLQDLFEQWEKVDAEVSEKTSIELLAKSISLENLLRNQMTFREATELLRHGLERSLAGFEEEEDATYLEVMNEECMKDAMFLMRKYSFDNTSLNQAIDHLFLSYQNLLTDYDNDEAYPEVILSHLQEFHKHISRIEEQILSMDPSIDIDEAAFLDDNDEDE